MVVAKKSKKAEGSVATPAPAEAADGKKKSMPNPASIKCKDKRTTLYKTFKKEKKIAKKKRQDVNKKEAEETGVCTVSLDAWLRKFTGGLSPGWPLF